MVQKRECLSQTITLPNFSEILVPTEEKPVKPMVPTRSEPVSQARAIETALIARAQSGDVRSFEALYERHKRRVFSLCLRMTRNHAQAEDFTQEAFLQLFRKIALFRGESAFSTWLHRLTVNVVLMHARKKGLNEVSLEETLEPRNEGEAPKEIGIRDETLHASNDRMALDQAIGNLPPGYRIIFVLHDVEGYEHNEIAELLGCSIGNSKSQLHKARIKLRSLLPLRARTEECPNEVIATAA